MKYTIEAWVSPWRQRIYASSYVAHQIPEHMGYDKLALALCDSQSNTSILNMLNSEARGLHFVVIEAFVSKIAGENIITMVVTEQSKCKNFAHLRSIWKSLRCEAPD